MADIEIRYPKVDSDPELNALIGEDNFNLAILGAQGKNKQVIAQLKKQIEEFGKATEKWLGKVGDAGAAELSERWLQITQGITAGTIGTHKHVYDYRIHGRWHARFVGGKHIQSTHLLKSYHVLKVRDGLYSGGTNEEYAPDIHEIDLREVGQGTPERALDMAKSEMITIFRKVAN